jgi:hypothetical protein
LNSRPPARFDHGNSHTAVGQTTPFISRQPSSRCATHQTHAFHPPTSRHSRALAHRRRVGLYVANVPRPDWRKAEISMIRAGRWRGRFKLLHVLQSLHLGHFFQGLQLHPNIEGSTGRSKWSLSLAAQISKYPDPPPPIPPALLPNGSGGRRWAH